MLENMIKCLRFAEATYPHIEFMKMNDEVSGTAMRTSFISLCEAEFPGENAQEIAFEACRFFTHYEYECAVWEFAHDVYHTVYMKNQQERMN